MIHNKLLEKLTTIPKSYFSLDDLKNFYSGKPESLKVILHRLVKQGRLKRLMRGWYSLYITQVHWEQFACELLPSYISLEYALHYYDIIDQVPTRITLVTNKKTREFKLKYNVLEYSHINPKFYFGYKIQGNFLIAEKEKAVLDELYLVSLKKRHLNIRNLNLGDINKKLFNKWLKDFPNCTQKLASQLKI